MYRHFTYLSYGTENMIKWKYYEMLDQMKTEYARAAKAFKHSIELEVFRVVHGIGACSFVHAHVDVFIVTHRKVGTTQGYTRDVTRT